MIEQLNIVPDCDFNPIMEKMMLQKGVTWK
uniref:Uncharacterized protein n=1 Tax=Rhizophora mucronata TaxID=61149 RepID=A0A2P2QZK1_RHIMU